MILCRKKLYRFLTSQPNKLFQPSCQILSSSYNLPTFSLLTFCNNIHFSSKGIKIVFYVCRPATLLKNSLWHRWFPVNFAKFLRTCFLENTSGACFCKLIFNAYNASSKLRLFFLIYPLDSYKVFLLYKKKKKRALFFRGIRQRYL